MATHVLRAQATDGATGLYPRTVVYNSAGAVVDTVSLSHVAGGLYSGTCTVPSAGTYFAVTQFFSDAGRTIDAGYGREGEEFTIAADPTPEVNPLDVPLADHRTPGTAGEAIALTLGLAGQHNQKVDQMSYNAAGLLVSARKRVFPSAADAQAGTNPLKTYTAVATPDSGSNANRPSAFVVKEEP